MLLPVHMTTMSGQEPAVTDLGPLSEIVCVHAESFTISGSNGNIVPGGDHGFYVRDTRFLTRLQLRIDDTPPVHLAGASVGGNRAVFHGYLPSSNDAEVDPTVSVTRRRVVHGGLREEIDLRNAGAEAVALSVTVTVGSDFAYIFDVKHGHVLDEVAPDPSGDCVVLRRPGGDECTQIRMEGGVAEGGVLVRKVVIPPGDAETVVIEVVAMDRHGATPPHPGARGDLAAPMLGLAGPPMSGRLFRCSDARFTRLVRRSIRDLSSLELTDPDAQEDRFAAAGSPWFLTLFGRDSIWAAFMALPWDLDLARGTLRVLARRQGQRIDRETEEEPGKILHEVRRGALAHRGDLPPFYYGTVDATPLFVMLAHEAWCWGLPEEDLRALLPNVEAALAWMRDHGDPDGDGFLEYVRHGERGLANQGWKDSRDGVRFADGTIALAPLALSEVQGYAYDAAMRGAALLEHFGRPDADEWRVWATRLKDRFRASFWVEDDQGPYPAVALDETKRPVDSVASNMGHLLMSGILDRDETGYVAARLGSPAMASGWGLRTLAESSGGYNPLSYHCGAVWPHDTAIAVWGLSRTGHVQEAAALMKALVRAAPTFHYRLPELFSGFSSAFAAVPVPYPTACRPQAWAAAGTLLLVRALLGVDARVPDGYVRVHPLDPSPVEWIEMTGLPLAGGTLDLRLHDGDIAVELHDADVDVRFEHA